MGGAPVLEGCLIEGDDCRAVWGGLDAITNAPGVRIGGRPGIQGNLGMNPVGAILRGHQAYAWTVFVAEPVVGHVDRSVVGAVGPIVHGDRREAADPGWVEVLQEALRPAFPEVVAVGHGHCDSAA